MCQRTYLGAILFFVVLTIPAAAVNSAEIEGHIYKDTHAAKTQELRLVGVGLLRYLGFKAYTGAFYLEAGIPTDKALTDVAKRIELEYMRPIKGEDFGPATDKGIAANVDQQTLERLRSRIDFHNSLYEDVQPGDRYSLTYSPGIGTELAKNGESKGIIQGADFAAAVFSIWIGPNPVKKSFKRQLLGQ